MFFHEPSPLIPQKLGFVCCSSCLEALFWFLIIKLLTQMSPPKRGLARALYCVLTLSTAFTSILIVLFITWCGLSTPEGKNLESTSLSFFFVAVRSGHEDLLIEWMTEWMNLWLMHSHRSANELLLRTLRVIEDSRVLRPESTHFPPVIQRDTSQSSLGWHVKTALSCPSHHWEVWILGAV